MKFLTWPSPRQARRLKLARYVEARREVNAMSDADLADIGIRRYQLGHVARKKVFG